MLRFGDQSGSTAALIFDDQGAVETGADITGAGAMQAQNSTVVGAGIRTVVDIGGPPDLFVGVGTVVGVGEITKVGSGVLQAQSSTVVGTGANLESSIGSGSLQAGSSTVSGVGQVGIGGQGALVAQSAAVAGIGALAGAVFGTGVLVSGDSSVAGAGERSIVGAGNLLVQGSMVSASGVVIQLAVDYVCYLPPTTIELEVLSVAVSYPLEFSNPRNIPRSVTADWDAIVQYHAGVEPDTDVAYTFSNGRKFVKDRGDD